MDMNKTFINKKLSIAISFRLNSILTGLISLFKINEQSSMQGTYSSRLGTIKHFLKEFKSQHVIKLPVTWG